MPDAPTERIPAAGRAADGRRVPDGMAAEGCARGAGVDDAARPPGHGVRRACGAPGDHGPVHVDPLPARLCGVRPVEDPRAGTRLVPRADDRRDDRAAGRRGRRSRAGGRAGVDAGVDRRGGHDRRRLREAGVRRRSPVAADHDRLHERARHHHPGGPAPEALRLLDRRRRLRRRAAGLRRRRARRRDGVRRARCRVCWRWR